MKKLLILHCAIGAKSQFYDIAKPIGDVKEVNTLNFFWSWRFGFAKSLFN
jgi:hypothetical protein